MKKKRKDYDESVFLSFTSHIKSVFAAYRLSMPAHQYLSREPPARSSLTAADQDTGGWCIPVPAITAGFLFSLWGWRKKSFQICCSWMAGTSFSFLFHSINSLVFPFLQRTDGKVCWWLNEEKERKKEKETIDRPYQPMDTLHWHLSCWLGLKEHL